jgi:predicted transposase YdaD
MLGTKAELRQARFYREAYAEGQEKMLMAGGFRSNRVKTIAKQCNLDV